MTRFIIQLIAIITMTCDHIGMLLLDYPSAEYDFFRNIGRLAYPLFAFMIGEGTRYTRNIWKYFLRIFIIGFLMELFAFLAQFVFGDIGHVDLNIYLTLSLGILIIALLKNKKIYMKFLSIIPFLILLITEVWVRKIDICGKTLHTTFEYGFYGVLSIVAFGLFDKPILKSISLIVLALAFSSPLCDSIFKGYIVSLDASEHLSTLVIPVFFLYNKQVGIRIPKFITYMYYPVHLVILFLISMLI